MCIVLMLAACSSSGLLVQNDGFYLLTVMKADWILKFPSGNFIVQAETVESNGTTAYFVFRDFESGYNLYVHVESDRKYDHPETYLEEKWEYSRKKLPPVHNVRKTGTDEYCIVSYFVPDELYKGNINVVYYRGGLFIDMRLSKLYFTEADNAFFQAFFPGVEFVDKKETALPAEEGLIEE